MGSGSGSLVGILLLADRYIPAFGPETPGQDDLWIHLNNGIKLSDGFIQTVYIAITRQRYRLSSSNTAHVGLRDNVLAAWMRGTVDPAARPTQHYLFIRRCICIGYPFKSISAFPLRILVSYVPRSLTCIGTARLLAWELNISRGLGQACRRWLSVFLGLAVGTEPQSSVNMHLTSWFRKLPRWPC